MSYSFACDSHGAFTMDPLHNRVGYLTDFNGLGLSTGLAKDLTVYSPYSNTMPPAYTPIGVPANNTVNVTAVLEEFSWNGGVGDPRLFSCYLSSQNANQLRMLMQATLKTTSISALGFWIAGYDQGTKQWFEQVYPKTPEKLSGQLNVSSSHTPQIQVDNVPVQVAPNINVYKLSFAVVPAANQQSAILIASSATTPLVKAWGLVVGKTP